MSGTDAILSRLDNLLKECESKISKIELRLPEYEEPTESLSRRVAELLEPASEPAPPQVPAVPAEAEPLNPIQEASSQQEPGPSIEAQTPPPVDDAAQAGSAGEIREADLGEQPPRWPALLALCRKPALCAAVAVIAAALFWIAQGLRVKETSFALPPDALMGLAPAPGGGFLSMDSSLGALVRLSPRDGKVRLQSLRDIDIPKMGRLAWGSGGLWVAGGKKGLLYRYASVSGNAEPQIYPQFHRYPALISIDQDTLWSVDEKGRRIDKYLISQALTGVSLALLGSYPLPGGISPAGMHESNGVIWLLDAANLHIRRYGDSGAALKPLDSFDLKPWWGSSARLEGLAVEGGGLWILDAASRTLKRLRLGAIKWTPLGGPASARP